MDKGGSVVILDNGLYRSLHLEMLQDLSTYRALGSDPTPAFPQNLKRLLQEGVVTDAITAKLAEGLYVEQPVTPIYHSFPKVHKNCFPPPLRPIVAGIRGLGGRLGSWVDLHLQLLYAYVTRISTGHEACGYFVRRCG